MDALSEVLRMIRLRGALFLNGFFHEPWCVQVPPGADAARVLCPGARHLAILHMVLEGSCWVRLAGEEPFRMQAGDVVALPAGDAHVIGCELRQQPVDPRHALRLKLPELAPLRYGGEGEATTLVCGWFAYEGDAANPLLAALPRVLRVPLGGRPSGRWIAQSLRYALDEAAASQPGATALTAKVAESMFLETLRAYLDGMPPQQSGWLAGLRDPQVGHCLALMHEQPARNWSLDSLAREVHSSRSVLSERFTVLLGTPPMKYLKHWRLSLAARLLCSDRSKLLEVAEAVGYESEASFSRAFKGAYGVSPGAWRATAGQGTPLRP
jgi:AraC-like DNA-binding protein